MNEKNYSYIIKVGDILHNLGAKDTIVFSNKFSTFLPQISEGGMSFKISLQSLSNEQLLLSIPKIIIPLSLQCDYCGKDYEKTLYIKRITTKAVKHSLLDTDEGYEVSIDEKNHIINIEKWVTEAIILSLPVNNMCEECGKKESNNTDDSIEKTNIIRKKM